MTLEAARAPPSPPSKRTGSPVSTCVVMTQGKLLVFHGNPFSIRGDRWPWLKASVAGAGGVVPPHPHLAVGPHQQHSSGGCPGGLSPHTPTLPPSASRCAFPRDSEAGSPVLKKPSLSAHHSLLGDTCPGQSLPSPPQLSPQPHWDLLGPWPAASKAREPLEVHQISNWKREAHRTPVFIPFQFFLNSKMCV